MAPAAAAQMIQERLLLIAFALQMVRAPVNQPRFACTEQQPPSAPEKGRRTGPHSFDHYAIQPPVKGSSGEALGKPWGRLKLKGLFERCSGDRRSYRNKKPADNSLSAGVATQGQMISNRIARSDRRM